MYRIVNKVIAIDGKLMYYCIEKRKRLLYIIPYWSKKIFKNKGMSRFCFTLTKEDANEIVKVLNIR